MKAKEIAAKIQELLDQGVEGFDAFKKVVLLDVQELTKVAHTRNGPGSLERLYREYNVKWNSALARVKERNPAWPVEQNAFVKTLGLIAELSDADLHEFVLAICEVKADVRYIKGPAILAPTWSPLDRLSVMEARELAALMFGIPK